MVGQLVGMPKVTLEVSEEVAKRLKELEAALKMLEADRTGEVSAVTEGQVDGMRSANTVLGDRRRVVARGAVGAAGSTRRGDALVGLQQPERCLPEDVLFELALDVGGRDRGRPVRGGEFEHPQLVPARQQAEQVSQVRAGLEPV